MLKPLVIVGGILLALVPWMSGGREPLAIIISVFGVLITGFLVLRRPNRELVAGLPLRAITAAWLGWAALTLIWSVNHFQTELWILYALIGVLVFVFTALLDPSERKLLLKGYTWAATVVALYGVYLLFTADYNRLTSSFYWANPAAAYLAPAAILAGWWAITERRWYVIIQALILAAGVWLTDSRGAMLATIIALAAAFISPAVRRKWLPILGLTVVSFGLSVGVSALRTHFLHQTSVTPGSRLSEAAQGESTSFDDRKNYLISTFAIWRNHPLGGSGAGTYATVHPQFQQRVISASTDAHNIVAQTLAEQGLIGGLIIVGLGIVLAWGVGRGVFRDPTSGAAAAGALMLAIHFGLDIDDRYPALIALLAMLLGTSYQPWRQRSVHRRQLATIPALLIITLALAASNYRSGILYEQGMIHDDNHTLLTAAETYQNAHTGIMYDPDTWTAEGIDYYTAAAITGGSKKYTALARDRAQQAIARDPKDGQHYFLLGNVERLDGNTGAAIKAYRQAIELDPWNHPAYYLNLASLLKQKGNTAEARDVASRAIDLYPPAVLKNRSGDASLPSVIESLKALKASL